MEPKYSIFGRPVTEAEIRQLERERAERLDPANRPVNAEVDNSEREWDYDRDDFVDNIVDGKSKFDGVSAPVPLAQQPVLLRSLGVGLGLVALGFLWLSGAFFTKAFTEYDDVRVVSDKSGLALAQGGDVKLRGMIVGTIREIGSEDGKVVVTMGMDPELIDRVPRNVRAEIVPKTLFGEKFISLVPTAATREHLRAGDVITNAVVPIEFEKFFNDVYPLLTAIPPEKIAYTLTALANSLEGRGDALGATLADTNEYLEKLNPESRQAVEDIVKLGAVSDAYAGQMQDFGELLKNSAHVSRAVVDLEDDLADFFAETDTLAATLSGFLAAIDDDLIATARNSVQPLQVGEEYSTIFPCFLKGLDLYLRSTMDSVLRNGVLHIQLIPINPQPTAYDIATERPIIPTEETIESSSHTQPEVHGYAADGSWKGLGTICDELKQTIAGAGPNSHGDPLKTPPSFWKLWGVKNSHNGKLGTDAEYQRAPLSSNLAGIDSPAQKDALNRMTAGLSGIDPERVPDVASLLISPMVRGASVSVR